MKWFRFYDEVLDDPKCQRLTPVMFKHWVNILCIANRSNHRGTLPPIADIAFSLRLSEAKSQTILNDLVAAGLLDRNGDETYSPHGWKQRQRVSDDVAKRVAEHRSKSVPETEVKQGQKQKSNVTGNTSATLPHVRGTEAETETETETDPVVPTGEGVASPVRENAQPTPPPPTAPTINGPMPLPAGFAVSDTMRKWAEKAGFSADMADYETEKFCDYYAAKGELAVDWQAKWRNWIRRELDERNTFRTIQQLPTTRALPKGRTGGLSRAELEAIAAGEDL